MHSEQKSIQYSTTLSWAKAQLISQCSKHLDAFHHQRQILLRVDRFPQTFQSQHVRHQNECSYEYHSLSKTRSRSQRIVTRRTTKTHHVPVSRVSCSIVQDLEHLDRRARRVQADDGGQRRNGRLATRGIPRHERPMDGNLVHVIEGGDRCCLVQEHHVLLLRIPTHCSK